MATRLRAELLLIGITIIWGSTYIAIQAGLAETGPFTLVCLRFAAAALCFVPFARGLSTAYWGRGALLGVLACAAFSFQTVGLETTTTARSAFLTGLFIVLTPPLDFLIHRRRPRVGSLVALPIVLVGLVLLTSPDVEPWRPGDWWTLGSALAFSLHIIYIDRFTRILDFRRLTFVQFMATALCALPPALLFESFRAQLTPVGWLALAHLVLPATVALFYVQMRFQKETTPVRAAVIYSLEPVFAALFAMVLLAERLGPREVSGAALMLAGVILAESWPALQPWLQRRLLSNSSSRVNSGSRSHRG